MTMVASGVAAVPCAKREHVPGADLRPAQGAARVGRRRAGTGVALGVEPTGTRKPEAPEGLGEAEDRGIDVGGVALPDGALADVDDVHASVEREGRAYVLLRTG